MPKGLEAKSLAIKTVIVLAILLALTIGLKFLIGDYVEMAGGWFVNTFGYWGIFFGTVFIDTINFPLSPDFMLLFAITGGLHPVPTIIFAAFGSMVGASCAYWIGRVASNIKPIAWWMKRKEKTGHFLFNKYGHWTILIAAVTPLPFGALCWFAGAYKMNWWLFYLITLIRLPRMIVPFILLYLGWSIA